MTDSPSSAVTKAVELQVAKINSRELMSMIGKMPFSIKQLNLLMQKTPAKFVKERAIRGGNKAKYVEISYVVGLLNLVTGYRWDFEILDEKEVDGQIVVKGQLTVGTKEGREIKKTQYGGSEVKTYSEGKNAGKTINLADDYKSAASDCLKKCASLLGVAWDVYGSDELREVQILEQQIKKAEEPEVLTEDLGKVSKRVTDKLNTLSSVDRIKAMKVVGRMNVKDFTEANWRRLDDYFTQEDEKANP